MIPKVSSVCFRVVNAAAVAYPSADEALPDPRSGLEGIFGERMVYERSRGDALVKAAMFCALAPILDPEVLDIQAERVITEIEADAHLTTQAIIEARAP